jgi:hypothetical protein
LIVSISPTHFNMASLLPRAIGRLSGLFLLVALVPVPALAAVPHDICASFNTAGTNRNESIYQTNGLCSDFCKDQYAYAITQEESCWCSNYTPSSSSQVSKGRCNEPCPAYPDEMCGGRGLFSYVEMKGKLPAGSKGPNPATTRVSANPLLRASYTLSYPRTLCTFTIPLGLASYLEPRLIFLSFRIIVAAAITSFPILLYLHGRCCVLWFAPACSVAPTASD